MTERKFVACPYGCGAEIEEGIDCRQAAFGCPNDPDRALLAPYMSPHRRYDLSNWLDCYNIRGEIERRLRACADYRATYPHRAAQVLDNWRRHHNALSRLREIEEATLPIKEGNRK